MPAIALRTISSPVLAESLLLSGLRKTGDITRREAKQVPILNDIMDYEVFGPLLRQGMELGRVAGRTEGERHLMLRMFSQRFGPVPDWATSRIATMSATDLERIAVRVFDSSQPGRWARVSRSFSFSTHDPPRQEGCSGAAKRYPTQGSVSRYCGFEGWGSIFLRNWFTTTRRYSTSSP
ncbi:MAG: hypothetical protein QOJ99_281 [Bryobacterales bacterium]|nr:hypothetical protein [Bryobacterales bacterium]